MQVQLSKMWSSMLLAFIKHLWWALARVGRLELVSGGVRVGLRTSAGGVRGRLGVAGVQHGHEGCGLNWVDACLTMSCHP